MRMLLDHVLEMERLSVAEAGTYAEGLYLANKHFANYVDLCYNRAWSSRWYRKKLPKFKLDSVPYGYHLSQLEKTIGKFQKAGFTNETEGNNLEDKRALNLLHQVMESVSDVEQKFLKQILGGKLPYLSLEKWKELRRM